MPGSRRHSRVAAFEADVAHQLAAAFRGGEISIDDYGTASVTIQQRVDNRMLAESSTKSIGSKLRVDHGFQYSRVECKQSDSSWSCEFLWQCCWRWIDRTVYVVYEAEFWPPSAEHLESPTRAF